MYNLYIHYLKDQDKPFYCGVGKPGREKETGMQRNDLWRSLVEDNTNYNIKILMISDKETCKYVEERLTIAYFSEGHCQTNKRAGMKWLKPEYNPMFGNPNKRNVGKENGRFGKPIGAKPGKDHPNYGKPAWNKGLRKGDKDV